MVEKECFIGLIQQGCDSSLITLTGLREHIEYRAEINAKIAEMGVVAKWAYYEEWSLKDYADGRKSTNLTRFKYCPECGKKIDWAAIRRMENDR